MISTAASNKSPAILEMKELPRAYFFGWLYVRQVLARWPLRSYRACHTLSLYPRPRLNARGFVRVGLHCRQSCVLVSAIAASRLNLLQASRIRFALPSRASGLNPLFV